MSLKLLLTLAVAGLLAGCGIDGEPLTPPAKSARAVQTLPV